jgi:DNA invertase Pin-like site-specific DNA recombinase
MKVGYARVSTIEQNPELQFDALRSAGCEKIFQDKISGAKAERPGLAEALAYLRPGDSLVVWRLDRLGRSLKHLLEVVEELEGRGVSFVVLQDGFDTATINGKLFFQIFGALAEFERNLIRERTMAGLTAARARGRKGGRKEKLTAKQVETLRKMADSRQHSVMEICRLLSISKPTYYRYLRVDHDR